MRLERNAGVRRNPGRTIFFFGFFSVDRIGTYIYVQFSTTRHVDYVHTTVAAAAYGGPPRTVRQTGSRPCHYDTRRYARSRNGRYAYTRAHTTYTCGHTTCTRRVVRTRTAVEDDADGRDDGAAVVRRDEQAAPSSSPQTRDAVFRFLLFHVRACVFFFPRRNFYVGTDRGRIHHHRRRRSSDARTKTDRNLPRLVPLTTTTRTETTTTR